VNDAWQGVVDSAPFEGYFLARLMVSKYLLRCGHVGFACCLITRIPWNMFFCSKFASYKHRNKFGSVTLKIKTKSTEN
jgi:hypothetical protein